jgi:hypothetical protein
MQKLMRGKLQKDPLKRLASKEILALLTVK